MNYEKVQANNNKKVSLQLGLNKFADLTSVEFKQQYLRTLPKNTKNAKKNLVKLPKATSTSADWVMAGAVTAVKDQAQCGSCWAFSTTGALEGLNFITNGYLESYSEQQLVDCASSYGNMGCSGGLMDYGFEYTKDHGIEAESAYRYTARDGNCRADGTSEFKNTGYSDIDSGMDNIMSALEIQPVSLGIAADDVQLYEGGIMTREECSSTQVDHGVLLVAYGTDAGTDFWKIKNSWGGSWGEEGYFRVQRYDDYLPQPCQMDQQASVPTLN
jgi:cathepsin L